MPQYDESTWEKLAEAVAQSAGSVEVALRRLRAEDPLFATMNKTTVYRALRRPGTREAIMQRMGEARKEQILLFQQLEEKLLTDPEFKDKSLRQLWEMSLRKNLVLGLAGDPYAFRMATDLLRFGQNVPDLRLPEEAPPAPALEESPGPSASDGNPTGTLHLERSV